MSSRNDTEVQPDDEGLPQFSSESQSPKPARRRAPVRTVKRSRTGCLTCRARKVKCDESQPICENCKRCVLECRWPVVENLSSIKARRKNNSAVASNAHASNSGRDSASSELRSNPDLSKEDGSNTPCNGCRTVRCRCSHERPSCSRCRQLSLVCKYQPANSTDEPMQGVELQETAPKSLPLADRTRNSDSTCNINELPKNLIQKHIQAFFTNIYPCQANGFLHRGTLLQNFHSDRIDKKLLLAICAASSRFVDDPAMSAYDSARAEVWAKEAKTLLILEDMTTDTVAAALLLARHEINSGNYSSAWMLSSMATRAALALGLNKETRADNATASFTEQEARRRLFWACYCFDRMMSTGLSELVILRDEHIRLQLPCEEHQFLFGIQCWTPVMNLEVESPAIGQSLSQSQRDIGLFGHYVQIMQMRYSMLRYVRNHPENPKELPPWDPSSTFAECVYKMPTWKKSLPPQFQLLPNTIYMHQSQDQLSPLIMLHVWHEQCMSDLYRIVMPGFPETLPSSMLSQAPVGWVQQHQSACVSHANNIASIFETVAALVDMEKFVFLDTSLPMCVFESMCVRLQWLFMPPSEAVEERIEECKESFRTLMTYVENMAKYFRQGKWLLNEMRKTLLRHGIHISISSETYNNDSSDGEAGSHPWQKRIQRLTDEKNKKVDRQNLQENSRSIQDSTVNIQQIVTGGEANQNATHADANLSSRPVDTSSLYPVTQGMTFNDMLYDNGVMIPPNGWGEAEVIPGLANFMGMAGEWVANGVDEEAGMTSFDEMGGQ